MFSVWYWLPLFVTPCQQTSTCASLLTLFQLTLLDDTTMSASMDFYCAILSNNLLIIGLMIGSSNFVLSVYDIERYTAVTLIRPC